MKEYLQKKEVRYFITVSFISLVGFFIFIFFNKILKFQGPEAFIFGYISAEIPGFYYKRKWVFENEDKKRMTLQFIVYVFYSFSYLITNVFLMHQFTVINGYEEISSQILISFTLYLPNLDVHKWIFTVQKTR